MPKSLGAIAGGTLFRSFAGAFPAPAFPAPALRRRQQEAHQFSIRQFQRAFQAVYSLRNRSFLAIRPALAVAASSQQYRLAQQSHSAILEQKSVDKNAFY